VFVGVFVELFVEVFVELLVGVFFGGPGCDGVVTVRIYTLLGRAGRATSKIELADLPNAPAAAATVEPGAATVTERLALDDNATALSLYGERNANLKVAAEVTRTTIHSRGNEVTIMGAPDAVALARNLVTQLYAMVHRGTPIAPQDIGRAASVLRADHRADLRQVFSDTILVAGRARPIAPKSLAQKRYVDAIRNHDIVFGIGPAGTGKTYLAMALAVRALMEKQVKRIILTRPAVEAGEHGGEGLAVPAAALRRAPRHDGLREGRPAGGARPHRGGAHRVHARAHAE
jgi:rRNA processing protein Krr1/Pno1